MPTRPPSYCRQPGCPHHATAYGFCPTHDPGWRPTGGLPSGWKRIRRAVLARDGYACQFCGAAATDVDHIVPRHLGGPHTPDNLRALCHTCHRVHTGQQRGEASARASGKD